MNEQDTARCQSEIQEIERHKYFLSEKAGYDVGWEAAEADWEARFADQWRRRRQDAAHSANAHASHDAVVKASTVEARTVEARTVEARIVEPLTGESTASEVTSANSDRTSNGKSPSWFQRLFSRNYTVR